MASDKLSPSIAPTWLLRATNKLEKSIFRKAEHKYRSIIEFLQNRVNELELINENALCDITRLENELIAEQNRVEELEGELVLYKKPEVAVKDIEKEVFRVVPLTGERIETKKKRKLKADQEIDRLNQLRDDPPSKILKVTPTPAPRSVPPPPQVTPNKNKNKDKSERSTSPQPMTQVSNLFKKKRERSTSPQPTISHQPPVPLDSIHDIGQRKKRKKEKDKKNE